MDRMWPSAVIFLVLLLRQTSSDIPDCNYFDTVGLSDSQRLPNGSYIYEGLLIPGRLTGEYDYRLMPDHAKEPVDRHWRGCVCQLRPCVRFCCRPDQILDYGECNDTMERELDQVDPYLNVTRADGSVVKRHFRTELIVQTDLPMPCAVPYPLDNRDEADTYTLYENGSFLRHFDNVMLNKREYCIQHIQLDPGDPQSTRIVPNNCPTVPSKTGQTVVMMASLICMILTIAVYLYVDKLRRNLHGKCFICYMVCLFVGYLLLLLDLWDISADFCITAGFIGYFAVLSAFFWLSVISLHLWHGIGGSSSAHNRFLPKYLFLAFNAYAYGLAAILTAVIYLVDTFVDRTVPENLDWMPRVGYASCWINTRDWSAMLYFYGPMLVLIVFNMTMFTLTAARIVAVKKELRSITQRQERKQKLNSDKQTHSFFLRLFILMGMSWSLEIVSYLVQSNDFWEKVLKVADYFNWSQGIIIFVLFVLKRSTLKLCMERPVNKCRYSAYSMRSHIGGQSSSRVIHKLPKTSYYSETSTAV